MDGLNMVMTKGTTETNYIRAILLNVTDFNNPTNAELYKNFSRYTGTKSIKFVKTDSTYSVNDGLEIKVQIDNSTGSTDLGPYNCIKLCSYYASNYEYHFALVELDNPVTIKAGETCNFTITLKDLFPNMPETVTD